MLFPSFRYHATEEPRIVQDEEEDEALGEGWKSSPADHGIETAPGAAPDPDILANLPEPVKVKARTKAQKMADAQ